MYQYQCHWTQPVLIIIITENYQNLSKNTENLPKAKLPKTNPNPSPASFTRFRVMRLGFRVRIRVWVKIKIQLFELFCRQTDKHKKQKHIHDRCDAVDEFVLLQLYHHHHHHLIYS